MMEGPISAHDNSKRPTDPTPSDADIQMTRELVHAGQVLKVEVLRHHWQHDPILAARTRVLLVE
jgi:hypothetical protein